MAKITRIKASDSAKGSSRPIKKQAKPTAQSQPAKNKTALKTALKGAKTPKTAEKAPKSNLKTKKPLPKGIKIIQKPFAFIGKPLVTLARYIKASWREIRQVRWPNRKTTWKMVFAVLMYTILFAAIIMILDAIFTLIFNNLLK